MNAIEANELVDKLLASAESERAIGNTAAAQTFEAKAEKLRRRYNLTAAAPAAEPITPPVMQPRKQNDYFSDFPGVSAPERPLTNEQLAALRDAAAAVGRPLTDRETDRALGRKERDTYPTGDVISWL